MYEGDQFRFVCFFICFQYDDCDDCFVVDVVRNFDDGCFGNGRMFVQYVFEFGGIDVFVVVNDYVFFVIDDEEKVFFVDVFDVICM